MALSDDNPFFNFSRAQCVSAIKKIQDRMLLNAQQVSHAGSGSVSQAESKNDRVNLRFLRERLAELDELEGVSSATKQPTVKVWRLRPTVSAE